MKNTLVIGASTNPERYSYRAITQLRRHDHPVIALGLKTGVVADVMIATEWNPNWQVDTITLYLNPRRQEAFYDKIVALHPRRVIFNPGTENPVLEGLLHKTGIETDEACTLVMLSVGQY
ncbi:MAG: CoA-binding protein [Candidatus Fluviicola riflensis]|nr:MAG: CoA-binding protein [Candidatus Fluviicola riflensis]OGS77494.1 MAG: CoA-binding protein [Candidatus Fluviicola riflensis]OGS84074.1 MAG: CoA-binding protein [Fluviicola sp. RIFCSPHIGHO2_12_FULL_43_24]OGS84560.1 MAG: CoA-binding protein [Fluviicola sp. RIFCSPHIGHO2_01_FULL_43_53]